MEKEDVKIGFSPAGENAQGKEYVCVDVSGLNEKAVAEGASLAAWNYKNEAKIETITGTVSLDLIHEDAEAKKLWAHGRVTAEGE